MDIRQALGQGLQIVTMPHNLWKEQVLFLSTTRVQSISASLTIYSNLILFPSWPFGWLSCPAGWNWVVNTILCYNRIRTVGSRLYGKRREAMWCKSIQGLQSGLHILILTFISHETLNVFLSLLSLCVFTWKKENSCFFNLIKFNKGLNKISCEATCTDFGTQFFVLIASYFIPYFLLRASRYNLSLKE